MCKYLLITTLIVLLCSFECNGYVLRGKTDKQDQLKSAALAMIQGEYCIVYVYALPYV